MGVRAAPASRRTARVDGLRRRRLDNSVVESFFGTLRLELLDQHHWDSREQLALAIFEWIEAWYNPRRRHSYCGMLSPADYEAAHTRRHAA